MSRPARIETATALADLPGWAAVESDLDGLVKKFRFKDFNAAFGWMTRVAMRAELLDHHPTWSNDYATVQVLLFTHDADGVTALDVTLAKFMDEAAAGLSH